MGYAKHIGRVGALAVTLGVGAAMATMPGIAYADEVGSAPSATDTTSTQTSTSTDGSTAATSSPDGVDAGTSPSEESKPGPADDTEADASDADEDDEQAATEQPGSGDVEVAPKDDVTPAAPADSHNAPQENAPQANASLEDNVTAEPAAADQHHGAPASTATPPADDDAQEGSLSEPEPAGPVSKQEVTPSGDNDVISQTATTFAAGSTVKTSLSMNNTVHSPQPRPTLVDVVSTFVTKVLQPIFSWGFGSPIDLPVVFAGLAAVRDELERAIFGSATNNVVAQQTVSQVVAPENQHVLVIGVDGTNLRRILDDPENDNFFDLLDTSTTHAASIVGHTTISNPSWTAILTGAWDNRSGVINNVFTPWTYDKFPTVFNQLEKLNPAIQTTAIADWDVISAIAGAGSTHVDTNVFVPQLSGDTNWLATDDAIGDATVAAIEGVDGSAPSFLFSYFVGVDENGHMYGGASPQYAEAIRNVDDNLGEILAAVKAREDAGEDWTILVVTDHGHQPQQGVGHGFQSPDETATFVIADGPDFKDGWVNTKYQIVDVTPTVLDLFGGTARKFDGVSMLTLDQYDVDPGADLQQALRAQIAQNHAPDPLVNALLSARTIFATIPYLVYTDLPTIPVLSDLLYVVTNVPAQFVAALTGVYGARLFPLLPPPHPSFPQETTPATVVPDCSADALTAESCVAV